MCHSILTISVLIGTIRASCRVLKLLLFQFLSKPQCQGHKVHMWLSWNVKKYWKVPDRIWKQEPNNLCVFIFTGEFCQPHRGHWCPWPGLQCRHKKSERVLTCQKYLKECIEVKVKETLGWGSLLTLKLQKLKWYLCGLQLRTFHDSRCMMLFGLTTLWSLALVWKCLGGAYFTGLLQHLDNI